MRMLNIDYLSKVEESDLSQHARRLMSIIRNTKGRQKESAEIDLCYVQRELEVRRRRQAAHREFIAKNPRRRSR
tara:strand:- start:560 stop:781 length:222 start_codon:yes stop_codon:yes gene_type:complete